MLDDLRKKLCQKMLRIRRIEEKIGNLAAIGEIHCPTHLCIGEEAIAVGICANLEPRDYVFSTYRGHGHYLAKGGDLKKLFAELFGKEAGCAKGHGGSMHLVEPAVNFLGTSALVGGCLPIATGTALASKLRGEDRVTVVFFGDGAVEEGAFHESLNFASLHKLPIIFVCENNLYAVNSPIAARQPVNAPIVGRARGYGIVSALIDGNDCMAVREISAELIAHARSGNGPALIEAQTFRWSVHVEHYSEIAARKAMLPHWQDKCPIKKILETLNADEVLAAVSVMEKEIVAEIADAEKFAKEVK